MRLDNSISVRQTGQCDQYTESHIQPTEDQFFQFDHCTVKKMPTQWVKTYQGHNLFETYLKL